METLPDYLNSGCEMFNYQVYFKHNSFISATLKAVSLQCVWDQTNADIHKAKHGIDFNNAETALNDPNAYTLHSPRNNEDRYQTFCELNGQIICVIHTRDQSITGIAEIQCVIISIRPASRKERRLYYGNRNNIQSK